MAFWIWLSLEQMKITLMFLARNGMTARINNSKEERTQCQVFLQLRSESTCFSCLCCSLFSKVAAVLFKACEEADDAPAAFIRNPF